MLGKVAEVFWKLPFLQCSKPSCLILGRGYCVDAASRKLCLLPPSVPFSTKLKIKWGEDVLGD